MFRFAVTLILTSVTICAAQSTGCLYSNLEGFGVRESNVPLEESSPDTECDTDDTKNTREDIASGHQSKSDTPICGVRNVEGIILRTSVRISGDIEAEYGEFPWMVILLKKDLLFGEVTTVYRCGGSLIHPSVVVTAAHCISRDNNYLVRAGEWNTQDSNEQFPTQDREIADYIIHGEYRKTGLFNDIALLFLMEPFKIASNVRTICLPPQNHNFDLEHCIVSGWGNTKFNEETTQAILKRVELEIVPRDDCLKKLREVDVRPGFDLHDSFICAGGEQGKDTCKGDGGGPLVCPIPNTKNRYYQAGIVSWGIGCGNSIPGVYGNVALFRNWIEEKLESNGIPKSYFVAT